MEPDEIEAASKPGTNPRNDKNAVIDYDEDRVRLELIARVWCRTSRNLRASWKIVTQCMIFRELKSILLSTLSM